jgi:hypothetical protein
VNNLSNGINNIDFVAIKTGDVNASASFSNLTGSIEDRNGNLSIVIDDQLILEGDVIRLPVNSDDLAQMAGYQFSLKFNTNALEFLDIEYNTTAKECFGLNEIENGIIKTSWDNSKNTTHTNSAGNNTTLFTLIFRAKTNSTISKQIQLADNSIEAEAYLRNDKQINLMKLNLEFGKADVAYGFELFQNTPNPYKDKTIIGFRLPQASQATLTVFDLSGKVLKTVSRSFEAGYNQVQFDSKELGVSGVLFYQLDTPEQTATKRMVRL